MTKMRTLVIDAEKEHKEKQKTLNIAGILLTIAIYLITAGTLMDYVSIPVVLKTIGFILTGHAFFFLWKASQKK